MPAPFAKANLSPTGSLAPQVFASTFGHESWDKVINSKIFLEIKVTDSLGQVSFANKTSLFKPENGYDFKELEKPELGLSSEEDIPNLNRRFIDYQGRQWFHNSKAIYLYSDGQWSKKDILTPLEEFTETTFTPSAFIRNIVVDENDGFWISSNKGVYYYKNEDDWKVYTKSFFTNPASTFDGIEKEVVLTESGDILAVRGGSVYKKQGDSFVGFGCASLMAISTKF